MDLLLSLKLPPLFSCVEVVKKYIWENMSSPSLLPPHNAFLPILPKAFKREEKMVERIINPHIVRILDFSCLPYPLSPLPRRSFFSPPSPFSFLSVRKVADYLKTGSSRDKDAHDNSDYIHGFPFFLLPSFLSRSPLFFPLF